MAVTMVPVGDGVELCAETYGDAADPALLLLAGATSSMDAWEPELCATPGSAVASSSATTTATPAHRPRGRWGQPGYTGEDLSLDPLRLLDGLGVEAAHLVGVSMGGGIAQDLAVRFPDAGAQPDPDRDERRLRARRRDAAAADGSRRCST